MPPSPAPCHASFLEEKVCDFAPSGATTLSTAANPGGLEGLAVASAAAAAFSYEAGDTRDRVAPVAIPPPFPRATTAAWAPNADVFTSASGSGIDLSSDTKPAAAALPTVAGPLATHAPWAGVPLSVFGASPVASPPPLAALAPSSWPASSPIAKHTRNSREVHHLEASTKSAAAAAWAFWMYFVDPDAAAASAGPLT